MNYQLELNTQEPNSHIVFHNIMFDSFKINIVERYSGRMNFNPKLCEAVFKVRTLNDELIKRRDGNIKIKIKGDEFEDYQKLKDVLNSYEYKNRLISRKNVEEDYVHFILRLVISNYQLS